MISNFDFNIVVKRTKTKIKNKMIPIVSLIPHVEDQPICAIHCNSEYLDKHEFSNENIAQIMKNKILDFSEQKNMDPIEVLQSMSHQMNGVLYPNKKGWLIFMKTLSSHSQEELEEKLNDVYMKKSEFTEELDKWFKTL